MTLLPANVVLPDLYAIEDQGSDAHALVHLFHPNTHWHWYLLERGQGEKADVLFGLVHGFEVEYGYISLAELERNGVEYDPDWTPRRVGTIEQAARHDELN